MDLNLKEDQFFPTALTEQLFSNDATIGVNVTFYHQVTIGDDYDESSTNGDNVLMEVGAKIVGPVKIGNNVRIGADCVVACDIPNNATVMMEKTRIIIKDRD